MRITLAVGLLATAAAWSGTQAMADSGHERDRALRELTATVEQIRDVRSDDESTWLEAVVRTATGERIDVRVAPTEFLEGSEFAIGEGARVRLRFFLGEDPAGVQRIRNLDTGQTLRLRCLHGEPLWGRLPRRGPGGTHHPESRGRGHHGGR